jgi:hypothetical protein
LKSSDRERSSQNLHRAGFPTPTHESMNERMENSEPRAELESDGDIELPNGSPPFPPLDSMITLFEWFSRYFCRGGFRDCRNFLVEFREEDFIHLMKTTDKYQDEPRNRLDTIRKIKAGEFKMFYGTAHSPANFSIHRAKELTCAISTIRAPEMIVPNWQPMGKANPGEAYIRNFGKGGRRRYRVLICGIAGKRRIPVTMFPRQRFNENETLIKLWP